jgi:hypothetical protein
MPAVVEVMLHDLNIDNQQDMLADELFHELTKQADSVGLDCPIPE